MPLGTNFGFGGRRRGIAERSNPEHSFRSGCRQVSCRPSDFDCDRGMLQYLLYRSLPMLLSRQTLYDPAPSAFDSGRSSRYIVAILHSHLHAVS